MHPVSRLGQPVGMVTTTSPWLSVICEPSPQWLWLTTWFQATPPLVFYPPTVWIPEYTHLIQWNRPSVKVIRLFSPVFSRSASLHHPHLSQPKIPEGWMSPEEVALFPMRENDFLTNQIIQIPGGRASRTCLHLCPPKLSGRASYKQAVLDEPMNKGVWPLLLLNQHLRDARLQPMNCLDGIHLPLLQVLKDIHPSSGFSSTFHTLMTDYRHRKQQMSKGNIAYEGKVELSTDIVTEDKTQNVCVSSDQEDQDKKKDKRPVASTPVPGSPWYVVWTGDDHMFFFNPTIHLSVWEKPGDLIGRDISRIIQDPPHKRKKTVSIDEDKDGKHVHKRSRAEGSMSLVPRPEVDLFPLELRIVHFREMMLERRVSAFSTWEKELHKMVFDPRYLLLTPDHRKEVFDQFVKSRVKHEYKEKKSKLQKAREDFKKLLEEEKITSRCTFKQFCARYHSDHRFNALNKKEYQEVLFNLHITSLKKRSKEKRACKRKSR